MGCAGSRVSAWQTGLPAGAVVMCSYTHRGVDVFRGSGSQGEPGENDYQQRCSEGTAERYICL